MADERGRLRKALSSFKEMVFPRSGWQMWSLPGTHVNYARAVGDGTGSSTVMAPLNWIARTFPAAPVALYRVLEDGQEEMETKHDLIRLLHRPNPYYTGKLLWQATAMDYYISGNAYWLKLRNRRGRGVPVQLWWVPSTMIEPKAPDNEDPSIFIDYYDYRPNGTQIRLSPADVVHFRFGIDGDNQRLGRSPMKSVLREVFTDDEAANYTAALLKNMGVPGIVISPKEGGQSGPSVEDVKDTKTYMKTQFSGDKRGEPLVLSGPTDVQAFGFSPEQMNLKDLRRVPEERVTAVLGIPAIVCGLGAGLDRSTFANFSEARKAAYESNTIPAQEVMAEDIRFQLLPDFEEDPMAWKVAFDLSDVRILQEDENKKAERLDTGVRGGWLKRSEARREMGFEATEADDVYLLPVSLVEISSEEAGGGQAAKEEESVAAAAEEAELTEQIEEEPAEEEAEELKRLGFGGTKQRGSGSASLKGKQKPYQKAIVKAFARDAAALQKALKEELYSDFHALGIKAAEAFSKVVKPDDLETKGRDLVELKLSDEYNAHQVVLELKMDDWIEYVLEKRLGKNTARALKQTLDTVQTALNLEIEVPATAEKALIKAGGTRSGLIDVKKQTKDSIMRAIAQGRKDKLDPKAIADLIKDEVPKGRYTKAGSSYRAELISRTEVKFAQNSASLTVYQASEHIKECIAFDGSSDEICAARDGTNFSFGEAESEAASEHPNGNLSFAPIVSVG